MQWFDLARRQHGVVARQQLLALGVTRHQVGTLLDQGHLVRHRVDGVYRAAATPSTPWAESWSAVLASRSVLAYASAAGHWDIPADGDGRLHVIPADRRRVRMPPTIRVHRVALTEGDVTERFGLPITTRTRTVLDCCGPLRYPIAGYFAHIAFPDMRLVVEVDGWAHHVNPDRFQADRTKQNAILAAGWSVLRYTWADLVDRPAQVVREIRAQLERVVA